MASVAVGDFELTMDELRVVARFATESAEEVLPIFEDAVPGDHRPRSAVEAAWEFINGAQRTKLQRVTSLEAHRAAKDATTEMVALAARSAGDAASAAYLHPIAKASQVGHILRATASAARVAELNAADDHSAGESVINRAAERATPVLIDVLCRYPVATTANSRVAQLMSMLDAVLRAERVSEVRGTLEE
ncbi:putative immunity protein [Microlunatus soli]|uniref:Imm-5-like domain-containing protein n=1 Tax=Microlunatus soli TaxID=630515 RepID=A0A1H1YUN2_9ACTN|nr:exonuclease SbcC [Microlunatus soli]SDT24999.1 hypothetical protein SAMN04489812_4786 [Microlunatus soli]